jgi:hypothetical protein
VPPPTSCELKKASIAARPFAISSVLMRRISIECHTSAGQRRRQKGFDVLTRREDVGIAWWTVGAASCWLRLINNPSVPIMSAPARPWAKFAKTVSKLRSVVARRP